MVRESFLRTENWSAVKDFFWTIYGNEGKSVSSQEPATEPCPVWDESEVHPFTLLC